MNQTIKNIIRVIFNKNTFYVILFLYGVIYIFNETPKCSFPIEYNLNNLDTRFEISENKAIEVLLFSEKVWEDSMGINLFEYKPIGKLKINFIFDERQQENIDAREHEKIINQSESYVDKAEKQYENLLSSYNQKLNLYNSSVEDYEQYLQSHNESTDYWNRRGGAPSKIYNQLLSEESKLESMYNQIVYQEQELSELGNKVDSLADVTNLNIDIYNTNVDVFNNKFGPAREFTQGDYIDNNINIYEFETTTDLKMVLAHEFGHALGLDHVENPHSVMYYLMEKQDIDNLKPTEEDISALKQYCGIE